MSDSFATREGAGTGLPLEAAALDQLFVEARTFNGWLPKPVDDATITRLYDLMRWGPTSANGSPGRFVFVRSPEGKRRLAPAMSQANLAKTMAAPVTVIVGFDTKFYDQLPKLFPHTDARSWFTSNEQLAHDTAFRNASLQGAYLIVAARALGLDCGPMSGYDAAKLDAEFFAGTSVKSNFLINLGYGDPASVLPRLPRLSFDEACRWA